MHTLMYAHGEPYAFFFLLRRLQRCKLGLDADKPVIDPFLIHQSLVAAIFCQSPVVDHINAIGPAQGTQAMGYSDGGPSFTKSGQGLLYLLF